MENRGNLMVRLPRMSSPFCSVDKSPDTKWEVNGSEIDDDDEISNKPSVMSIASTLSKLKRKVQASRSIDVKEKMDSNSAKLRTYTSHLSDLAKVLGEKSIAEEDKLTFRSQKVLCNFGNTDVGGDGKDEGSAIAVPIVFGNTSGGKTNVRPGKLAPQQNVPPYTTWIYLDRNQRMTEDQSVQGRRRIYYDPVGNETLIASDSEEEEIEEEEPKHDFSKGEDYIIWTAVQDSGASDILFDQIAQCIQVNRDEIQARYDLLRAEMDKQARCIAHAEFINSKVNPIHRHKGSKDTSRLTLKETQPGQDAVVLSQIGENTPTVKVEEQKLENKDLVAAMDSFDNLFCRRCLVFDCRLHGCSQPLVHPSEKQPPFAPEPGPQEPCGPQCYLLSQCAPVGTSNDRVPGILHSRVPDSSLHTQYTDKIRVAKKQKTEEGENSWSGKKRGSPNTTFTGVAELSTSEGGICSSADRALKSSTRRGENSTIPGGTEEDCLVTGSKDISQSLRKEQPSVASRLTSHKKLARISRRAAEDGFSNARDSHESQIRSHPIGSFRAEGGFSNQESARPSEKLAAEMVEQAIGVMADSHQLQFGQVSKELDRGENGSCKEREPKSRVTSTKKLARSGKRAFEDGFLQSDETLLVDTEGDPMDLGLGEMETLAHDSVNFPMVKKLVRTIDKAMAGVVATDVLPSLREGTATDVGLRGVLFKEKIKVTSPKKLARSARKFSGTSGLQHQTREGSLEFIHDEDKPLKEEKTRNTAARKLARSTRKVIAQKVAVAIQHQQQIQIDPMCSDGGEKEWSKGERFSAAVGGRLERFSTAVGTSPPQNGMHEPAALLTEDDKASQVNGSQSNDISAYMMGKGDITDENLECRRDRLPGSSIEVVGHMKGMTSDIEDTSKVNHWTALEKGLFEKGLQIFGNFSCMIAKNMLKGYKTCLEIGQYIAAQERASLLGSAGALHQFPDSLGCVPKWDVARARARFYGRRKGSRKLKFTLKSAGQSAIRKRMVNGKDVPCRQYTPCGCLFTCGKQCPCQLSGTCCEKYCGCAKSCKNRFRGCHCAKSQCCSRQCPCFAAGRECDPDVCRNCWIGCGEGKLVGSAQKEDKDNYQCHNMKLLLKQQQRVLLGRSDVAGWGAFLKNTVNKHEYLGEYTGELISHREADKRGKIYDRENSSFLFNLNDQYVLDACRKGDKLKFANHSPNPNCYAKVIMVAGDHRVGIFAKERIMAGEELFYDYRYEAERAPAWARKGEDNGNGRKDDSGPSERRSKHAS